LTGYDATVTVRAHVHAKLLEVKRTMFVRHHDPASGPRLAGIMAVLAVLFCLSLPWPRAAPGQSDDSGLECTRRVIVETDECFSDADGYFDRVGCELSEIRELIECTDVGWTDIVRQVIKL
jgi:hypothetical protein